MILNIVFARAFFKELKLVSFDAAIAATLGFPPFIIHYFLMTLVSLTAVTAFNAVGSILVVALMIDPAATAVLLTKDLKKTIILAPLLGVANSIIRYVIAVILDVNIASFY